MNLGKAKSLRGVYGDAMDFHRIRDISSGAVYVVAFHMQLKEDLALIFSN